MAANMFLSVLTIVLCFFCAITTATYSAEISDPPIFQDVLSLAADPNDFRNLTLPSAGAEPMCGAGIQKNRYPFAHLFKRADGCESIVSRTTYACASTQFCCTNPANRLDVWCCQNTAGCAAGTSSTYCTIRVNWVTLTNYVTYFTTQYQTSTISLPGNTNWVTITATKIEVVTKSDIATATSVVFVTFTAPAKKRWEPTPALPPQRSTDIAPSTVAAKATPHAKQPPQFPLITKFHPHGLLARQVMRTTTSTTSIFQTITVTRSSGVVGTAFYSVTSTRYVTVTTVFTSAVNAKTTVTVTSTLTQRADQTPVVLTVPGQQAPSPTAAPPNGLPNSSGVTGGTVPLSPQSTTAGGGTGTSGGQGSGSSGLSKTASIGIGAGTGAGSLIICIILAFFLHRRRKNRRAENQVLIEEAVAAATAAQSPRAPAQFIDYKPAMVGVAPIPMPPRPNHGSPSPHQSERYSDIMLYQSNGTSPAPEYQNSGSPQPYGHEMPLAPMTPAQHNQHQYQYPRPLSPEEVYAPSQSPIEMHHPVPQEISAVYSPRPNMQQSVPGPVYQQPGVGYPQPSTGYPQPGPGYPQPGQGYH